MQVIENDAFFTLALLRQNGIHFEKLSNGRSRSEVSKFLFNLLEPLKKPIGVFYFF